MPGLDPRGVGVSAPVTAAEAQTAQGSAEGRNGREEAAQRVSEAFPVGSYKEAAPHLRRPFTAQAMRWKVQASYGDKGCLVVGYIDARLVVERLNLVVPGLWTETHARDSDGLWCFLEIDGVTHADVGDGTGKSAASDALKRAAVRHGIGVSVYAVPRAELWASDPKHKTFFKYRKVTKGQKVVHEYRLTPEGEAALRLRYEAWLFGTAERPAVGVAAFGEPLDHGDVEDSQGGDELVAEGVEEVAAAPALLMVDREADDLRGELRQVYVDIGQQKGGRTKLPPARFNERLIEASVSHDALRALKVELEGTLAELKGGAS